MATANETFVHDGSPTARLTVVVAQLRHAYAQLKNEPADRTWGAPARQSFADGLIGPQIKAIEEVLLNARPCAQVCADHGCQTLPEHQHAARVAENVEPVK